MPKQPTRPVPAPAPAPAEQEEEEPVVEYNVGELADRPPRGGNPLSLLAAQLRGRRRGGSSQFLLLGSVIHPDNQWLQLWTKFILVWAVYSSFFTPMEFGFFRGLPENLFFLDIAGQAAFFVDLFLQFFIAYHDPHTYRLVTDHHLIALRYLQSSFIFDLLGCCPWDAIYKLSGRKELVRYMLWIRLSRCSRVLQFFKKLEKDIRINYLFTRIIKLIVVELYCTHTAACIFYHLATTLPESQEGYTWIGSLRLGDFSYSHFREIDFATRYITSLYFAIVTMATVGYGDIHAVNLREMVFIMIYVSLDMILGAYLIGNMTALIVKGSRTERFRDRMKDVLRYMNRYKLSQDLREQIKAHFRLQYESSYTEASIIQDMPVSIRSKISEMLYQKYVSHVPLFRGCSSEFLQQITIRLHEEFFLPGEVIMEQGDAVDQLYFVCHGLLEAVGIGEDGLEETIVQLKPSSSFGEIAILCNIPQPYTVRVAELCRLLRLDKQSFTNIMEIYFADGRTVLSNLTEAATESGLRIKQLETDVAVYIRKQEAELALRLCSAAFYGDLQHLKALIRGGANPSKMDYDGRTPLHLAASKGYENIVLFLVREGADINPSDKFGNTPLLEAVKHGHDRVALLLHARGGRLDMKEPGCQLCSATSRGDSDFIRRVLAYGGDPNASDYDRRTPLHIAAAEGLCLIARMLIKAGASVVATDRWGNTPLDEGRRCGSEPLMTLLEEARVGELARYSACDQQGLQGKVDLRRTCSIFPYHPWDTVAVQERKEGVVLWVPHSVYDLITSAAEQLGLSGGTLRLLSEDGAVITEIGMIADRQKLHLVTDCGGIIDDDHEQ